MMGATEFSIAADIATVITCAIAIFSLIAGGRQFKATQRATKENQAVELFLKFNQLCVAQANEDNSESKHWYNNAKFAITESIFEIEADSDSWKNTVKWMLSKQREFISDGNFEVDTYSKKFRDFCKNAGYELKR